jgi:hypothetical protein
MEWAFGDGLRDCERFDELALVWVGFWKLCRKNGNGGAFVEKD